MKKFHSIHWIIITITSVAVLCLIAILTISFILQRQVIYPPHAQTEPLPTELLDRVSLNFDEKTPNFEQFFITADDGYKMEAAFIPASTPSNKYVILVHGITRNITASMKMYPLFHDLGYNVILFSLRNHGNNVDSFTTYGALEKYDLRDVVEYTYNRFGENIHVGLHGISMGASIALQYAGLDDANVDFVISDCAYKSANAELKYQLSEMYPSLAWFPFIETTTILTKVTHGSKADLNEASPIDAMPNIDVPVFLIHGLADDYIPTTMAVELYQAKTSGFRELWLVPNAGHDDSLETDVAAYESHLAQFLDEIGY